MSEAKDMRFNSNEFESSAYASSIASNLSKAESQMQSASTSFAKEDSYREAAQMVTQQGAGFNQDMSQKYVNWLSEQEVGGKQLGAPGVNHVISDEGINRRYMQNFIESEGGQLREQFRNQAPIDPAPMKEQYVQQTKEVRGFNNPTNGYNEAAKTVIRDAEKQELTKNISSPDMPEKINKRLQDSDQTLVSKKLNLQTDRNQIAGKFSAQKD